MNRYPVGTRVVLIDGSGEMDKKHIGWTGVVSGHAENPRYRCDHLVMIDDDPLPDGRPWAVDFRDLRPIRDDDANTVTSWADCIWKPEGVAA